MQVHDQGLLPKGKNISASFVRKFLVEHVSVDLEIDRMDPRLRAAAKSLGAERIVAATPYDRIEQDTLHVPIMVNVDGHAASNVHLVHSIDCCTGMPTGWHLMVGQPSESDGLRCVSSTMYSKRAAFERLGLDKEIDIDLYGTMGTLVLDNGPEGRGARMLRLARLGATVNYCKSRHPHHKPFIERLNRSLKRALQRLRGSTRFDGRDGARDPVAAGDVLMTLEELERWIVRWYYQKWARHELKRHVWSDFHGLEKLGHTPEQRWRNSQKRGYVARPSPALSAWQLTVYERDERTLNRKTGIGFEGFEYKGPNLKYLVEQYGEVKVKILFDPEDYRHIFVFDGDGSPLVELVEAHVRPETPAFSFAYMKAQRAEMAAQAQKDSVADKFDRDMHQHAVEAAAGRAKKPSKREQNKQATMRTKETQAVERAAQRPVCTPHASVSAPAESTGAYTFGDDVPELQALSRSRRGSQE